jgi:hypothetical protein
MTQTPSQPPTVEVRPQPNVYTVILLVAVIALALAVAIVFWKLTSPPPAGYGLNFGAMFEPFKTPPG